MHVDLPQLWDAAAQQDGVIRDRQQPAGHRVTTVVVRRYTNLIAANAALQADRPRRLLRNHGLGCRSGRQCLGAGHLAWTAMACGRDALQGNITSEACLYSGRYVWTTISITVPGVGRAATATQARTG